MLVENALGDLALAIFTPSPAILADNLVEMLVGDPHASKPDLGLVFADLFETSAPGEVQLVGPARGPLFRSGGRTMKNETDGLDAGLIEVVGGLERTNSGLILNWHSRVPQQGRSFIHVH